MKLKTLVNLERGISYILMALAILAITWCIQSKHQVGRLLEQADNIDKTFDPLYLYDDTVTTGLDRRLANKDQLIIELDERISELEDKLIDLRVETAKLSGASSTPLLEGVMNTALQFGLDKWLIANKEEE
jgi:hypothetical protein